MDLHGQIMNINPEKRKQNLAIDEAMKSSKSVHEMLVKVYARAFRDAKHAAAEIAAEHCVQLTGGDSPAKLDLSALESLLANEQGSTPPTSN